MEAKEERGAPLNRADWSKEEVRIYEGACAEYVKVKSSDRAWLRFLGGEQ